MRIPNYDVEDDAVSNFKQIYNFMPHQCFRILICGRSRRFRENKHINAYDLQYAVF